MKEFLFGWLAKNKFELTGYDEIKATIEIIIIFFIGCLLWVGIQIIK